MKKKIFNLIKITVAIVIFLSVLYLLYLWPIEVLLGLFVFVKIKEHWTIVKAILITSIISCIGGFVILWIIHLLFTGALFVDMHSMWGIGYLFSSIYALGLLIEEDQRAPYIWAWRQIKKIKKLAIV